MSACYRPLCLTICLPLIIGCGDAKRNNPLDARSPHFVGERGEVYGRVVSLKFTPIDSAEVTLPPSTFRVFSDQNGDFSLNGVSPGAYTLWIQKEGYNGISLPVTLKEGQALDTGEHRIDALPFFSSRLATSSHLFTHSLPAEDFHITFSTEVDDPDGFQDVDSVFATVPKLGARWELPFDVGSRRFRTTFSDAEISPYTVQQLIGREVFFEATDRAGAKGRSGLSLVERVLAVEPVPLTPPGPEPSEVKPRFVWESYPGRFMLSYGVEVFRERLYRPPLRVFFVTGLASSDTSYVFDIPLVAGEYGWALWVFDEFGNSVRSRELFFLVAD